MEEQPGTGSNPRAQRLEGRAAALENEITKWVARGYFVEQDDGLSVIIGSPSGIRMELRSTEHSTVLTRLLGDPETTIRTLTPAALGVLFSALLIVVGSFGTWASHPAASVPGTQGDGTLTIWLSFFSALFVFIATRLDRMGDIVFRLLGAFGFVLILLIGANSFQNVRDMQSQLAAIDVGWGLWVVVLASFSGIVATAIIPMPKPSRLRRN